jgi:hypothetical protein
LLQEVQKWAPVLAQAWALESVQVLALVKVPEMVLTSALESEKLLQEVQK